MCQANSIPRVCASFGRCAIIRPPWGLLCASRSTVIRSPSGPVDSEPAPGLWRGCSAYAAGTACIAPVPLNRLADEDADMCLRPAETHQGECVD